MSVERSYDLASFAIDPRAEIRRLKAQLDLFWEQELALYRRLGLADGMQVLDCGCGPGYLLEKLASLYPSLLCAGVEIDPVLFQVASDTARQKGLAGWTFYQRSVTDTGLPADSYDFVIMRLVLEHLAEPQAALREVLRVLKPGATAVFIDNDFDFHERTWPDCPALSELYGAYRRARQAAGGNPCIGRRLPSLLSAAGYQDVTLDLLRAHSELNGDEAFLKAEGAGIPTQLVKTGFLQAEALEEITGQWAAMLSQDGHAVFRMLFAAAGKKPHSRQELKGGSALAAADRHHSLIPRLEGRGRPGGTRQPQDILRLMRQVLEAEMEMPDESLPVNEPLIEAGVDSLAALKLCNRLKSEWALSLRLVDVLSGKSLQELAQDVLAQLAKQETLQA